MSKAVKILILVLSILPVILWVLGYIGSSYSIMNSVAPMLSSSASKSGSPNANQLVGGFVIMFVTMGGSCFLALCMQIFYIWNLVVTNRVPREMRPVWGVLLVLGSIIAWIIYWYCYIWGEPELPETTTAIPSMECHGSTDTPSV